MDALPAEVGDLEDVPERYRDLYTESDTGTYRVAVQGVEFPDDVKGLKTALERERSTASMLKKKLRDYEEVDPDEYQRLRQEAKERERRKAEERGEYERLLGETKEEYEARITAKEEALAAKDRQLREVIRDRELQSAFSAAGLRPGASDLALSYASKFVETREDDGRVRPVVVDAEGKPRLNDNGDEMSISDFVAEFKASDAGSALFASEMGRGSGAAGRSAGAGGTSRSRSEMTTAEKAALIREAREKGMTDPHKVLLELP